MLVNKNKMELIILNHYLNKNMINFIKKIDYKITIYKLHMILKLVDGKRN